MKEISDRAISIIGGADGPTSVFVAGITQRKYASQKNCLKESLISRYKSELLGELKEVIRTISFVADNIECIGAKKCQKRYMCDQEKVNQNLGL